MTKDGFSLKLTRNLPYLSVNREKSAANLNGKIQATSFKTGEEAIFRCRHYQNCIHYAKDGDYKSVLKSISKGDAQNWNYGAIENSFSAQQKSYYQDSIIVSNEHLGEFVLALIKINPEEKFFSLPVIFTCTWSGLVGHAMELIIKKRTIEGQEEIDIQFYEPNVSGDMMHIKNSPLQIAKLSLDDFDARKVLSRYKVKHVLVNLESLSASKNHEINKQFLSEKFKSRELSSLLQSLGTAISASNTKEFDQLLQMLPPSHNPDWETVDFKELNLGIRFALEYQIKCMESIGKLSNYLEQLGPKIRNQSMGNIFFDTAKNISCNSHAKSMAEIYAKLRPHIKINDRTHIAAQYIKRLDELISTQKTNDASSPVVQELTQWTEFFKLENGTEKTTLINALKESCESGQKNSLKFISRNSRR